MLSVAPFTAAWRRRMANLPGPTAGSGEASDGEPVQVEILVDGQWTDITSYVMVRNDQGRITITYGIRDEGSQTEQSRSLLPLRNTDGRFTRRNPTGPYYGKIGRNTPCRISVPDGLGGKSYRQQSEISKWPKQWDPSGNDVWVDVNADGILQRLSQAPPADHSVIYQAVTDPLAASVVAYWPCEDPAGATQLASALVSGSPMTWTGTPTLASYEGFAASDPLPDLTTAVLSGGVARYDEPTATQVRFLASIPKGGLSDGKVLCAIDQFDYSAGAPQFWELFYTTTGNTLWLRQCDSDGNVLGIELVHTLDVRGRQLYVSVEFQESGASINRALRLTDVNTRTVYEVTDTAAASALSRVTGVQFGPASRSAVGPLGTQYLPGVAIGHVTVQNDITATNALGVRLNPIGETAGRRIQRLCAEEGLPFDWVGDLDDTVAMGAQGKSNPITLIREAVLADGGMLYENRAILGLGYRTRASLYNQDPAVVLDYAGYNLSEIPAPVEDEQYLANRVVVSVGSVTVTYEETEGPLSTAPPPAGVGAYGANKDSPVTLNLATTDTATLLDQAAWRVHLGTVDEDRFPQISVNLAHASFVSNPAMKQAVLALRLGDRIQVDNPPLWVGPDAIDQLIVGISEEITHFEHRLTFTCAPASPYSVGVLDAAATIIDTDGSQLLTAAASSDTEINVIPSPGETTLWSTSDTDAPWDILVGGEIMTVTSCSSYFYDSFSRTETDTWGAADSSQTWALTGTAADFDVTSGYGSVTLPATGVAHLALLTSPGPDVDLYGMVATSALATGASLLGGLLVRAVDNNNHYMARLEFTTSSTIIVTLRKRLAGSETVLGTYTPAITHVAGTFYRVRIRADGARLRVKVWETSEAEPGTWHIDTTDSSHSAAGSVGTRSFSNAGNTNVNPQIRYDEFDLVNIQTMPVTRAVNGVSKAHAAGTDVRLAHPTYLAL